MGLNLRTLHLGRTKHFVWERELLTGNLVIVVIDDECQVAVADPDDVLILDQAVLPHLRKHACSWEETRAIGFFRLMGSKAGAAEVLEFIHKRWLDKITDSDTQVYFLVDILYGDGVGVAVPHIMEKLTKSYLYPQACIAYLTRGGNSVLVDLPDVCTTFLKGDEAGWAQTHKSLSPKLMSFFGRGMHADSIIADAIQFYAQAWEASWKKESWHHDRFEETDSDQLRILAEWLGNSISIDYLYRSPNKGESAKSLMIWKPDHLWEDPPWKANDRRPIQGKILNAIMKKLKIPLTVSETEFITPPCVPCFPFLVSLRNFLWRCQKEAVEISKIDFFKDGENPQENMLRLLLEDNEVCHALAERFFSIGKHGTREPGALTRSLRDLTHCRTPELIGGEARDYMRLFREGTELPVVDVKFDSCQINLIWHVG